MTTPTTPPITASVGSPTPIPERPTLYAVVLPPQNGDRWLVYNGFAHESIDAYIKYAMQIPGSVLVTIPGSTTTPAPASGEGTSLLWEVLDRDEQVRGAFMLESEARWFLRANFAKNGKLRRSQSSQDTATSADCGGCGHPISDHGDNGCNVLVDSAWTVSNTRPCGCQRKRTDPRFVRQMPPEEQEKIMSQAAAVVASGRRYVVANSDVHADGWVVCDSEGDGVWAFSSQGAAACAANLANDAYAAGAASIATRDSGQGGEKKLAPLNMKYPATRDGAEAMCLDAIAENPDGSVYDCLMLPNGAVASTLGNTQLAVEVIVDLMMRFARTKEAECSSGSSAGSSDTSPASVGTGSGMGTAKQTSTLLSTPSASGAASPCDTTQPTPSVGSGEGVAEKIADALLEDNRGRKHDALWLCDGYGNAEEGMGRDTLVRVIQAQMDPCGRRHLGSTLAGPQAPATPSASPPRTCCGSGARRGAGAGTSSARMTTGASASRVVPDSPLSAPAPRSPSRCSTLCGR